MKNALLLTVTLLLLHRTAAQPIPVEDHSAPYNFIHTQFNYIRNLQGLDSFYSRLYQLKKNGTGLVSIVHIGDSHLQAGLVTAPVRRKMQAFFGNAGRGLVFPYQLAKSNAPPDIAASSNVRWQYNRLAHPEINLIPGISGFCIESQAANAVINLSLRPENDSAQTFSAIRLFSGAADTSLFVQAGDNTPGYLLVKSPEDSLPYQEMVLDKPAESFSVSFSGPLHRFYGASLRKSDTGLLYHTIGVNGATYAQYSNALLFRRQLAALHADLYIISLGTNEAQKATAGKDGFTLQVSSLLSALREISPGAAILITSPADSYLQGRTVSSPMKQVSHALEAYCTENNLPFWDLYTITGGYGSARSWERNKLMSHDRIHYISPGYAIQGDLLFTALANGYNNFIKRYNNPFDTLRNLPKTEDR